MKKQKRSNESRITELMPVDPSGAGSVTAAVADKPRLPEFARIPIGQIIEPEMPVRGKMGDREMDELVESMRALGQIEPITVERKDGMFEIITGHRRWFAAKRLRWTELAAMIYEEGQAEIFAMRINENAARESVNPAEEALFMAQAREKLKLDEDGLCKFFKRSPDYIAGRFALLRGDPEIFKVLLEGEIRLGVAHELNRITDDGMRRYYLDCARRADPPARVVHQWVEDWKLTVRPPLPIEGGNLVSMGANPAAGAPGDAGANGGTYVETTPAGYVAPRIACELCGGDKDPFNLVVIHIHKWELEQIKNSIARASRGD